MTDLFLGHTAVPCHFVHFVHEALGLTARGLGIDLVKVFGDGVADGGQGDVLVSQSFGTMSSPANECRVEDLSRVSLS